jgi:6-phosphogluconolactonase
MSQEFRLGKKTAWLLSSFLIVIAALLAGICPAQTAAGGKYLVYVGTYTDHGSLGIYAYNFDPATGQLTSLGLAAESAQPTFLAVDPGHKFLYAANEVQSYKGQPTGAVSSFSIDQGTGKLTMLNEVSAGDQGPAHLTLDRSGKYVLVANYTLGSVAVLPILHNGSLGEVSALVRHKGSSVNPKRQQGPHAHEVVMSPDNRLAIVPDLGLDELIVYPFDAAKGTLGTPHVVKIEPGSGPRHAVFGSNGRFLYLINELRSTVTVFTYEAAGGSLRQLQTISTLPAGFAGESNAAEIQIDPTGKFLYASNRGHDSIVVFAVDPAKGTLTAIEYTSTLGKTPRNFVIDPSGKWLLAANQNSNEIVSFRIDAKTGRLTATDARVEVSSPACIQFVPIP